MYVVLIVELLKGNVQKKKSINYIQQKHLPK